MSYKIILLLLGLTNASLAAATYESQSVSSAQFQPVGPGVSFMQERFTSGPLFFSVARVDLSNPRVTVKAEPGKDALFHGESVPDVVRREAKSTTSRVIAAVNADFWSMSPRPYMSTGLLVANDTICNMPNAKRSVFALTRSGERLLGRVNLEVKFYANGKSLSIDKINDSRDSGEKVILFTAPFGKAVPPLAGERYVLKMAGAEFLPNQKVAVRIGRVASDTTTTLSPGVIVLSVPENRHVRWLQSVNSGMLHARMPQVRGVVYACVGGGPRLVHQGKVTVESEAEGSGKSFTSDKHPRTAVGISADGRTLYLVVVDGRQPRLSVGQNLFDLAGYMLRLGCTEAMNLDGGGSSTMVIDNVVVNHPSDLRGPRSVTNSLIVLAEPGSGRPRKLAFEPSGSPLRAPTGVPLKLKIKAFDEADTPVALDPNGEVQVAVANISERANAAGDTIEMQTSRTPGTGTIQVQVGAATGELELRTVDTSGVHIDPPVLLLDSGEQQELDVRLSNSDKHVLFQPGMLKVEASDDSVSVTDTIVEARHAGRGNIRVALGEAATIVPYHVDESSKTLLASFDSIDRHLNITGSNYEPTDTGIQPVLSGHREGAAAMAVNYRMKRNGRTRISIPVGALIDRKPVKLGVWIFGDGEEAWLRANLLDARGTTFTVDFTDGGKGIYWKDEWRRAVCLFKDLVPERSSTVGDPQLPLVVKDLYLAQDQEALKTSGKVILDALEAEYPPSEYAHSSSPLPAK